MAKENNNTMEEIIKENKSSVRSSRNKVKMNTKKCKVLSYNKETKELDIDFDGYGVRLYNVAKDIGSYIEVQYTGEIGKSNFKCNI